VDNKERNRGEREKEERGEERGLLFQ